MTTDRDAIARVVQLYIDGSATGDAGKLKEAFHEDARMFGHVEGTRYDVPIQQYIELAVSAPADVAGTYKANITSIEQVGDAAVATLAEEGCWGEVAFVDYFALARIDGTWRIVNKTFAHTGGKMPGH
jgi:hypothetical protein